MSTDPSHTDSKSPHHAFGEVLRAEAHAILEAAARIDQSVDQAIELLSRIQGRVIFTGLGKSGCVARKAAATFCSTGTPAIFLHPSDALHGDLGIVTRDDVLVAVSNSGETAEILELLPHVVRLGVATIALTGRSESSLAMRSSVVLNASVAQEADDIALTPTSSTIVAMAMCDALAVTLMRQRGFTREQFAIFHPGGSLGKKLLLQVSDVMRMGDRVPTIAANEKLLAALEVISAKRMGAVFVVANNLQVVGVITDGDLRRWYQRLPVPGEMDAKQSHVSSHVDVGKVMTREPKTISANALAALALKVMEDHAITVLPALDQEGKLAGAIHLHDLIRAGLA